MSKISTIDHLNQGSFEAQVAVLSFLYESLFSDPQEESKINEILKPEFYPLIVKHAEDPDKSDKKMYVKLLGRAARNSTVETRSALVNAGALSIFLACLLSKGDEETKTEGLHSIMAIAVDQVHAKYMMVNGIIMLLINILTDLPNVQLVSLTLDTLLVLCKATHQEGDCRHVTPAIPFFPNLMDEYEKEDGVLARLCEICNILASKHVNENSLIYALKDTGVVKLFSTLLDHENERIRKNVVSFYLMLMTVQREDLVDELLKTPILEYCTNQFQDTKPTSDFTLKFIKGIKNIITFSKKGRKVIFDSKDLPKMLIDFINLSGNSKFQKQSLQALCNLTQGASKDEIQRLVDEGCIPAFSTVLSSRDGGVLDHALSGLQTILKFSDDRNKYMTQVEDCNCVYSLLEIVELKGTNSSETSKWILEQYFPASDGESMEENVEELLPTVDEEECQYQFNQEIAISGNVRF